MNELKPLGPLLLKAPPCFYARAYYRVADWLESVVNNDEAPGPPPLRPFFSSCSADEGDAAAETKTTTKKKRGKKKKETREERSGRRRAEIVADADACIERCGADRAEAERTWRRLCVADRVLSLADPSQFKASNARFGPLQRRVWWVRKAARWFAREECSSHHGYVRIALAALVLELFYRFVWARHTLLEYKRVSAVMASDAAAAAAAALPTEEAGEADDDDVLDLEELGEGDDDEDNEEEDDEDEEEGEDVVDEDESMAVDDAAPSSSAPAADCIEAEEVLVEADDSGAVVASGDSSGDDSSACEDQKSKTLEIPSRVALFFTQEAIVTAIDEIEGEWLERGDPLSPFDTSKAFWALARLVETRDMRRDGKPSSVLSVMDELMALYAKHYMRFLEKLCIRATTAPDAPSQQPQHLLWSWASCDEGFLRFVDSMYVAEFRNLTHDGERADTATLARLFPQLASIQDSRVDLRLPELCSSLAHSLASSGKHSAEVDRVVLTLNSLEDERKTLLLAAAAASEGETTPQELAALSLVAQSRKRRLAEIGELVERLRDEFHRLTASADSERPSKRKRAAAEAEALASSLAKTTL